MFYLHLKLKIQNIRLWHKACYDNYTLTVHPLQTEPLCQIMPVIETGTVLSQEKLN